MTRTVRLATAADIAALSGLLSRSFAALLPAGYSQPPDPVAVASMSRAKPELLTGGRYWVASCGSPQPAAAARSRHSEVARRPAGDFAGRYFHDSDSASSETLYAAGGWSRERPGSGERAHGLGHLRHFATDPAHTRAGHARAVFDACVTQMRDEGLERIECFAGLNAEAFYAAMGLVAARRLAIPIGGSAPVDVVLMRGRVPDDPAAR